MKSYLFLESTLNNKAPDLSEAPKPLTADLNKRINMRSNLELKAPSGKFRVVGVDTFDGTDWISGDYDTLDDAKKQAEAEGDTMLKTHVYDDTGKHVFEAGSF